VPSIVIELQKDALNPDVPVTVLLRKAFLIAKKLKIVDLEEWIGKELNGYDPEDDHPNYRIVTGTPKAWNPLMRSWIPVRMSNPEETRAISTRPCDMAVAEVEELVKDTDKGSVLGMPYPPALEADLMNGAELPFVPNLIISYTSLTGILNGVRNIILDWAIKLGEEGVLGVGPEGLAFTPQDKEKASNISYNLHFYGSVQDTQIQAGTQGSVQTHTVTHDIDKVREFVTDATAYQDQLPFNPHQKSEFENRIKAIEAQLALPEPKIEVITEALKSCRSILESFTGSVIASGLIYKLGLFLPH
jgi:hypothetical protein